MNKEFSRMQKLAGIITEGHTVRPDGTIKVHPRDKKRVKMENVGGDSQKIKAKYNEMMGRNPATTAKDVAKALGLPVEKVEMVVGSMTLSGGGLFEGKEKTKMTKREFKAKLKEMVLAEKKGKKSDSEGEEVEDVDIDVSDTASGSEDSDMSIEIGSSESKKVFNKLTDAFEAAKEFGDEKLIQQVANTIKYFNDNIILGTP